AERDEKISYSASETFVCDPVNTGMPLLDLRAKPVSFFEFWPAWIFYIPVAFYWVYLSCKYRNFGLPLVVNPNIELGGMVGESKMAILNDAGQLASSYILPFVAGELPATETLYNRDESLNAHVENEVVRAARAGVVFPFVVKPDLGCRGAGVCVVNSVDALARYFKSFPPGRQYMLQKLAPFVAEAGVFYERMPDAEAGSITSITLKYRPYVRGDGQRTLKQLILFDSRAHHLRDLYFAKNISRLAWVPAKGEWVTLAFAGSHCCGSVFRNGNEFISDAMTSKLDAILKDFPSFHYGRLDIKFKDMGSLMRGEDFVIIEVNGASSEATHIWDSRTGIIDVFATLFRQYRTLFEMGRLMRQRGHSVPSAITMIAVWLRELKQSKAYPPTD
ncbi:MAG: hypothetical protein ACI9Y1_001324, partial [Lentisphaeria bacterium]